jgi:hypothetical protein
MKRMNRGWAGLAAVVLLSMAGVARAADGPERWLHVKVNSVGDGESVRVNLPLSLAEKILPTISHGDLHNGKITCAGLEMSGVDLRAILQALKDTPDNEFVTVQSRENDVRVAKQAGNFVIHVLDHQKSKQQVDVIVPMAVVQALISSGTKELDVLAAIRALKGMGDTTLVTVHDGTDNVRVWIDSRNTAD